MKKCKKLYAVLLLLAVVLLSLSAPTAAATEGENGSDTASAQTEEKKTVTLMIYMTGSDLEQRTAAATNDLTEMLESGVDVTRVNLLVYAGGSKRWFTDGIATDANTILKLTADGFQVLETLPDSSMGDSATLNEFLTYGYSEFPADEYDLILWDHGNGPVMGYGLDKKYHNDSLTLPELSEALAASPFGEDCKLTWTGFDACLMASAELACVLADYSDYLVASQEVEPAIGWNYAFLDNLGVSETETLLCDILDCYMSACETYFEEKGTSDATLSCVRLSGADGLESAINNLFSSAMSDVSGDYSALAVERIEARALGRATTGSEYDLVDVTDLAEQMAEDYPEETAALSQALSDMIVGNRTNTSNLGGISLYYPYFNRDYYQDSWKEAYQAIDVLAEYRNYLLSYEQVWLGTDMTAYFEEDLVPEQTGDQTYSLQLTEEQAALYGRGMYYILERVGDELYTMKYASSDLTMTDGVVYAGFDGNVIYLENDFGEKYFPVMQEWDTVDGARRFTVYGWLEGTIEEATAGTPYYQGTSMSCDVHLTLNADGQLSMDSVLASQTVDEEDSSETTEEETADASEETSDANDSAINIGKQQSLDLNDWVMLNISYPQQRYLSRDENGRIQYYYDWPTQDVAMWRSFPVADGIHFTYEPLYDDGGEYYLMFAILDTQQNIYASELLPIQLAEAPDTGETSGTEETTQLVWSGEEQLTIYDQDGVTVRFAAPSALSTSSVISVAVENKNDYPVEVSLKNFLYNEGIYLNEPVTVTAEAKGSAQKEINIKNNMTLADEDTLTSLTSTLTVSNDITQKTLANDLPVYVEIRDMGASRLNFKPCLGAKADSQILVENDEVRITLEALGDEPDGDGDYLYAVLILDNLSDKELTVRLNGYRLNGIDFDEMYSTSIPPHKSTVCRASLSFKSALDGEDVDITSIDSVDLEIFVGETDGKSDSGGVWYPVTLA